MSCGAVIGFVREALEGKKRNNCSWAQVAVVTLESFVGRTVIRRRWALSVVVREMFDVLKCDGGLRLRKTDFAVPSFLVDIKHSQVCFF